MKLPTRVKDTAAVVAILSSATAAFVGAGSLKSALQDHSQQLPQAGAPPHQVSPTHTVVPTGSSPSVTVSAPSSSASASAARTQPGTSLVVQPIGRTRTAGRSPGGHAQTSPPDTQTPRPKPTDSPSVLALVQLLVKAPVK